MKTRISGFYKIILSVALAVLTVISVSAEIFTQGLSEDKLVKYAEDIVEYEKKFLDIPHGESLFSGEFLEYAGQDSADWFVIGISRMGLNEDFESYYYAFADNIIKNNTESTRATDWQRYTLTALSCGGDPRDINGVNALENGAYIDENIDGQGLNSWIWALIAINSWDFESKDSYRDIEDRENKIIDKILLSQLDDGGFALSGDKGDCDLTAMAVQALAAHRHQREDVNSGVEKALDFLSGKISEGSADNCESVAQLLCALCSADIDFKSDERFNAGEDLLETLIQYRNPDGGFSHIKGGESDPLSSSQALLALAAVHRYENGENRLYDFREDFSLRDYRFDSVSENQSEINDINAEIMHGLYPFEKLDAKQKKRLEKLYERVLKLPESDRKKITGYEEMKEICESGLSVKTAVLSVVIIAATLFAVIFSVKRFKGEKE